MEGARFDRLSKHIATQRVSRLTALRGLAAGAVASVTGVRLLGEEAGAKNNHEKKIRICHRSSATDPGVSKKLKKDKAQKHLKRHPFDTKGRCTAAPAPTSTVVSTTCDAAAPVQCGNSAFCCPTNLPKCCVRADIAAFACAPSGFECCGQFGAACAPGSEQCCQGAGDRYTPFEFETAYCAGAGQECCPWDFEDGACGAGENCCPPDLAFGGSQRPGCIPEGTTCCPFVGGLAQAAQPTGGFCESDEFCCPPNNGVPFGRCCPSFTNGAGGCCNPDASNPDAACPTGFVCEGFLNGFPAGCCVPGMMD